MNQVERAMTFCKAAHSAIGQVRKYSGEPYWTHPHAVMRIVEEVPHTEEQLIAALLHDTVEDTDVTLELIKSEFGETVATMVDWLTDKYVLPEHGNRATRKALECQRLAGAPADVQTVKMADLIHNSGSIVDGDKGFAQVYMKEKIALIDALTKADIQLRARAVAIVDKYIKNSVKPN
jgi:(p)ppGpp synthase/HD superfamily hydrolase